MENIECIRDVMILIKEGLVELYVSPHNVNKTGPGKKTDEPFYNSIMKFSRDLTVSVIKSWKNSVRTPQILDGLAGTGVRGIRIMTELGMPYEVYINDHNPDAYKLIRKNLEHNGLPTINSSNLDLNKILLNSNYSYVDIDPFGSPVKFMDNAIRSVHIGGIIAITATDTAALEGVANRALFRRYWAYNSNGYWSKETGMRILIANSVMRASVYDKSLLPLLSIRRDHYFRIFFKVVKYHEWKNEVGYMSVDDGNITINYDNDRTGYGPVWLGQLHDRSFAESIIKDFTNNKIDYKFLNRLYEESGMPPLFYDMVYVCRRLKIPQPPIEKVIDHLKHHGFRASRTIFSKTGVKSDADSSSFKNIVMEVSNTGVT
ncbi:MAG: hypothetical protein M1481_05790 [Candidatus Thermoplasmatota archaeon]|jgi:tRNA (guanine26-N2/guanine27-N2)-dimethyltransferase|nr:hypothetical protein [Candidatus Thermoplasmatota archaeon]MCL5963285.1 hypothetical protein [Candidatus Thermoplasmatota archaeon]